jgi:hypothetical protein
VSTLKRPWREKTLDILVGAVFAVGLAGPSLWGWWEGTADRVALGLAGSLGSSDLALLTAGLARMLGPAAGPTPVLLVLGLARAAREIGHRSTAASSPLTPSIDHGSICVAVPGGSGLAAAIPGAFGAGGGSPGSAARRWTPRG